jgi:hypothetical protein
LTVNVELNTFDFALAILQGEKHEALYRPMRSRGAKQPSFVSTWTDDDKLKAQIGAAAAEIAVARYLNAEWIADQYNGRHGFDVAPNIEVRYSITKIGLWIKEREVMPGPYRKPPSSRYVLTYPTDKPNVISIIGFINLDYGLSNSRRYRKNGVTGWVVDPNDLWPIERLKKVLAA